MQLTVIPKRPTWTARVLVRCTREVLPAPPLKFPALRALVPLILMMRPHFCSFMKGMAARAQRSAPTYFTLKSCSKSSSTTVSMGPVAVAEPPGAEPLLTRMCSPPSSAAACATIASTCALLATSAAIAMTRPLVSAASSCAAVSSLSFVRATMATSTPSRASSRAMALPMPRLPPVTIACLPRSPRSMACPPSGCGYGLASRAGFYRRCRPLAQPVHRGRKQREHALDLGLGRRRPERQAHRRMGELGTAADRQEHVGGVLGAGVTGRAARGVDVVQLELEQDALALNVAEAEVRVAGQALP